MFLLFTGKPEVPATTCNLLSFASCKTWYRTRANQIPALFIRRYKAFWIPEYRSSRWPSRVVLILAENAVEALWRLGNARMIRKARVAKQCGRRQENVLYVYSEPPWCPVVMRHLSSVRWAENSVYTISIDMALARRTRTGRANGYTNVANANALTDFGAALDGIVYQALRRRFDLNGIVIQPRGRCAIFRFRKSNLDMPLHHVRNGCI